MGLDTSHGCWHGAYSAFSRWREKIAEVGGYYHHTIDGHPGSCPDLDWANIEATIGKDLMGKWPQMPVRPDGTPDPLIILLAHSDCKGELQTEFLAAMAARLESLLPQLDGDGGGHIGSYREKTQEFIDGLRTAAAAGENVTFH